MPEIKPNSATNNKHVDETAGKNVLETATSVKSKKSAPSECEEETWTEAAEKAQDDLDKGETVTEEHAAEMEDHAAG